MTGLIRATNPSIIPRLKIFEPITLPTDMAGWSFNAAEIVTANSGAEVAIATTVNPITRSDIPNLRAIFEAESTIHEAPPQRPRTEKANIIVSNKILTYLSEN